MLMSWDIFTFIKPRGAKGQVLSCREEFEKSVPQNFESIVSHTKCRKNKSATTRIVIEKVWKRKRFPDQVGWVGFWQKKCLASNRSWEGEREETKSCPLLSCWVGKEGRGPQLHHRQLLLYKASFVLLHPDSSNGSSIFEIWVLQELYF